MVCLGTAALNIQEAQFLQAMRAEKFDARKKLPRQKLGTASGP